MRRIDFKAVREARRRLDEIALKHPELLGSRGRENVRGWVAEFKAREALAAAVAVYARAAKPRRR